MSLIRSALQLVKKTFQSNSTSSPAATTAASTSPATPSTIGTPCSASIRATWRGLDIRPPENYFLDGDPQQPVQVRWRSHANLLFANWLNYCVYQATS